MKRWYRIALLWLLAVALPLQGWTAAAMVLCGPSHHREALAAFSADATHGISGSLTSRQARSGLDKTHDHRAHGHASQGEDSTAGPVDSASQAETSEVEAGGCDHGAGGIGHHATSKLSKCSACASCCIGAALPAAVPTFSAAAPADFTSPVVPQARVAFLTGGQERPPRTPLA